MTPRTFRRIAGFYVFLLVFSVAPAAQQKHVPAETTRLIQALNVGPNGTVADIGAGEGEMTVELSRQLGPAARIYSTDVNDKTLAGLRDLVAREELTNVTVVKGEFDATALPEGCCDALFVRNVYHHFGDPEAMNASIFRTLKPGGRFAVMDFPPRKPVKGPVPPPERGSGDTHGVTLETVVRELEAAGFRILDTSRDWPGGLFLVLAERGWRESKKYEVGSMNKRNSHFLLHISYFQHGGVTFPHVESRLRGPAGHPVAVAAAGA